MKFNLANPPMKLNAEIRGTAILQKGAMNRTGVFKPVKSWNAYGKCNKCSCLSFEGNGSQCSSCGHWFKDHESTGAGY